MGELAPSALQAGTEVPIPIPVHQTGWTPSAYIQSGIAALLLPFLFALLKFWPTMLKIKVGADDSLRGDLLARVSELEKRGDEDRRNFEAKLRADRLECDRRLEAQQRKMDVITRRFFQFQMSLARFLPESAAPMAQQHSNEILRIISKPIEEFMTPAALADPDADLLKRMDDE